MTQLFDTAVLNTHGLPSARCTPSQSRPLRNGPVDSSALGTAVNTHTAPGPRVLTVQ